MPAQQCVDDMVIVIFEKPIAPALSPTPADTAVVLAISIAVSVTVFVNGLAFAEDARAPERPRVQHAQERHLSGNILAVVGRIGHRVLTEPERMQQAKVAQVVDLNQPLYLVAAQE